MLMRFILPLLVAAHLYGACTGSSPTWTSTADVASIQTCVNNATSGDTINVSSGAGTGTVNISKSVHIIGAGTNNTTINGGFSYAPTATEASKVFELSGFGITGTSPLLDLTAPNSSTPITGIKVHDNTFSNASGGGANGRAVVSETGMEYGVLYSNTFTNNNIAIYSAFGDGAGEAYPHALGSVNYLYVEDNTFTQNTVGSFLSETGQGGRLAVRHNTINFNCTGCELFDMHGSQLTGGWTISSEYYHNAITIGSNSDNRWANLRGGQAVIINNIITSTKVGLGWNVQEYRAHGGNNICTPYPVQLNAAENSCSPVNDTTCFMEQVHNSYFYNNQVNSSVQDPGIPTGGGTCGPDPPWGDENYIVLGREYWIPTAGLESALPATCTSGQTYGSTDTDKIWKCITPPNWTNVYTPFTYPHPLRNVAPACTLLPTSLSSVSLGNAVSVQFTESNCTAGLNFTKSGESPANCLATLGVSLSTGGLLSGTTIATGTCTFNVTYDTDTNPLSLSVTSGMACDQSTLQTAINNAARNSTVTCGSGSWVWSSTVNITKGLTLVGQGPGSTIITSSGGVALLNIQPDATAVTNSETISVSGFTWDGANTSLNLMLIHGANGETSTIPWRNLLIFNNTFQNQGFNTASADNGEDGAIQVHNASAACPSLGANCFGQIRGVIYHNTFDRCNVIIRPFSSDDPSEWANTAFNNLVYGTSDSLFFESNTIKFSSTYTGPNPGWVEMGQGGRLVMRFNTWNATNATCPLGGCEIWDVHGFQFWNGSPGSGDTGTMLAEAYNNTLTNMNVEFRWINHRGGQALFFDNTLTGSGSNVNNIYGVSAGVASCPSQISPTPTNYNAVVNNSYFWNNTVNGANQTAVSGGVFPSPCVVQENNAAALGNWWNQTATFNATVGIGVGTVGAQTISQKFPTCTTGVAFWATDQGNWNSSGTGGQGVLHKCTATNVWDSGTGTPYYTPFTFPHPLTASGVILSVSPASNNFGNQQTGTSSAAVTFTVTNIGNAGATGMACSLTGTNANQFVITNPGNCPTTLAANANFTLSITFSPTVSAAASANLTITAAAGNPGTASLSGTGIALAPIVTLSPTSVNCGLSNLTVQVTCSAVTLTNVGNANMTTIVVAAPSGTNASSFSQTNTCPATLAPSASCTITPKMTPQLAGSLSASIAITSNATSSPDSFPLSGTGVDPNAITLLHATSCGVQAFPGSCTIPATTAGSLLAVGFATPNGTTVNVCSISDGAADSFLQVSGARSINTAGTAMSDIWYAANIAAGTTSVTITTCTGFNAAAVIWEFTKVNAVDAGSALNSQSATVSPIGAPVAIHASAEAIVSICAEDLATTGIFSGNAFTNDSLVFANGWAHLITNSVGTYQAQWNTGNGTYSSSTAAFRVAPASVNSPSGISVGGSLKNGQISH